jgi:hypothetical protein
MWSLPPTLMIWPGLAVDATAEGEASADAAGADGPAEVGAIEDAAPPHALTASATTEARAANRVNLVLPIPLLLFPFARRPWRLERKAPGPPWAALLSLSSFPSAALHSIA